MPCDTYDEGTDQDRDDPFEGKSSSKILEPKTECHTKIICKDSSDQLVNHINIDRLAGKGGTPKKIPYIEATILKSHTAN